MMDRNNDSSQKLVDVEDVDASVEIERPNNLKNSSI